MSEQDGYVKIGAFIDPSGAQAGAAETVAAVNKVEDAAKDAALAEGKLGETGARAAEVLGSLRTAHHALAGIRELAMGGESALGGLATEGRVVTEIFEGMLGPLAPILLVITTLTALAIPMLEKWQEQKEKIDASKDSTDKLKSSTDDLKTSIDAVVDSSKKIEESDKARLQSIKDQQEATKALIEVNKQLAIEQARQEYLRGNRPDMSARELERRKKQFEATKADITDQSEVATAQLAYDNANQDIDETQKQRDDAAAAKKDYELKLKQAQDKSADARNFLANNRLKVSEDGKTVSADVDGEHIPDLVAEFERRIASLQAQANETRSHITKGTAGPSDDAARAELADQEKRLAAAQLSLAQVQNALSDAPLYDKAKEELEPKINDQDKQIADIEATLGKMQAQLTPLSKSVDAAKSKKANDDLERQQEEQRAADKLAQDQLREAQQNEDAKVIADLQEKLKALPAKDKAGRESVQAQIDAANKIKTKHDEDADLYKATGAAQYKITSDTPAIDALIASIQTKTGDVAPASQQTPLEKKISSLEAQIKKLQDEQKSNPAQAAFLQQDIAGLQKAEKDATDQDHAAAVSQATQALLNLSGNSAPTAKAITAYMNGLAQSGDKVATLLDDLAQAMSQGLAKNQQQIVDLQRAIKSLKNGGGYQ